MKFTAKTIQGQADGKHPPVMTDMASDPDCTGLYIRIGSSSRSWVMRWKVDGKLNERTLGRIGRIPLSDARRQVESHRVAMRDGGTPFAKPVKASVAMTTLRDDAHRYHRHMAGTWCLEHQRYWMASMERHVFPRLGDLDTAAITVQDIVAVLEPIWTDKNGTAIRLHGRIKAAIDYAMDTDDHGRFTGNPADRALRRLPKGQAKAQEPHPAIHWREAPALYQRLAGMDGQPAKALRLLLLCCTPRANEVIGARWDEIDGDNVWHVPADRMKSGKGRDIPLSDAAVALLRSIDTPKDGYVFTGRTGKVIGGTTFGRGRERIGGTFIPFAGTLQHDAMQNLLRNDLKIACHVHGLRATFRTWVSDHATTVRDHDAAEISLDHVIGNKVNRAYDRADMITERRQLAERWAAFLGA